MEHEVNDNEVFSDSQSFSLTRPSSAASSDMPKVNLRSRRNSLIKRQSTTIDINDTSLLETKQTPIKVIVVNGKCSQNFKTTLEDCVEDCILEYREEKNSVYVSKPGQTIQIPTGNNRTSNILLREHSANARLSAKSSRRRNSINQYNSQQALGSARTNVSNNLALPSIALAATASARIRHQIGQQQYHFVENISEEQLHVTQISTTPLIEPNTNQSEQASIYPDETISPSPPPEITILSSPTYQRTKRAVSYRERQKTYLLSDLVMLGPERYTHVFNLPRHQSQLRPRNENLTELDRIKQDLFHRYLWTKNPQVSCRICPAINYSRRATLVI
ncbi:unnamed protein product [Adineta ricciae]|uniref:Uncharacterized protein n=1 Tax=Adineta ricciae TaxID=249248 RepID=A0A815QTI1_ADIRI|nr:unnamed protein product [Adineta ricciae]